jgi:hypothetical protein
MNMPTRQSHEIAANFEQALRLEQSGDLARAEVMLREVLAHARCIWRMVLAWCASSSEWPA